MKGAHIDACDERGQTALHWACCTNNVSIVKLLLSSSALDIKDQNGFTPLDWARYKQYLDIVMLFELRRLPPLEFELELDNCMFYVE